MRLGVTAMVVLFVLQALGQNSRQLSGRVGPRMPSLTFRSTFEGGGADSEELGSLKRVDVLSNDQIIQTIQFPDDDSPLSFGPPEDQIRLEDVDCDGYKDLLVLKDVGYGGVNTWYFLFRYNVRSGKFERYSKFEELPFRKVNCTTKLVQTHNREGWAGCLYEEGTYRWVHGKLDPVRLEVSDPGEDASHVVRTVYVWVKGKKRLQSRRWYPIDDCHATRGGSRK